MKLEIVFKDGRNETFDGVASFSVTVEQITNKEWHTSNVVQFPTEGKLFEVNPLGIDRSKFEKPKSNQQQELTRVIINKAFTEVDKNPEKYASVFYTMIPEKKWNSYKTAVGLKMYAKELGGLMADWVEQALEWAQRIFNGESWEDICNNKDTANWYRLISWNDGSYRIVGGGPCGNLNNYPAFVVNHNVDAFADRIYNTVPLVVLKKK